MISKEKYKERVAFTYIGNLPKKFKFVNSTVIEPLSGKPLADKIKENYIYLTASINEPSGNHHIEAAQCGLPILFIDSGGIPEYCEGFGVKFSLENFEQKLDEYEGDLKRSVVEMAKDWRMDKMLRHLEALLLVMDKRNSFIIAGDGNVIEPDGPVLSIGSGGGFAQAAVRLQNLSHQHDR